MELNDTPEKRALAAERARLLAERHRIWQEEMIPVKQRWAAREDAGDFDSPENDTDGAALEAMRARIAAIDLRVTQIGDELAIVWDGE